VHGWTATAALNWFTVLPALAKRFHVVAMDVRGHGRGVQRRPFSLAACADDAAALCHELDLPPVVALGYSMGGPITQLLWRRHPGQVRALVLCATSTHFSQAHPLDAAFELAGRSLALGLAFLPDTARREVARWTLQNRTSDSRLSAWAIEERERSDLSSMVSAGVELRRYDARPWIGGIDVPTAVVATMQDQLVSPRSQLAMADAIAEATVFPVAGDHSSCATAPRLFQSALLAAVHDVVSRRPVGLAPGGT
jgi:pimeloyl-ACP methyl ester carboxylesterase